MSKKQSFVYVTQRPVPNGRGWCPNLSPAAKYGALQYIFEADERPYTDPNEALRCAEESLRDFDPELDYVLWPNTGDPIAAWAVIITLARRGFLQIKTLYWERKLEGGVRSSSEGFYSPIVFRLDNYPDTINVLTNFNK